MPLKKYSVYILRCGDNSLYTGIALDFEKRFREHQERRGAKYTMIKSKHPLRLEFLYEVGSRSEASKVEASIKKLKKAEKEVLLSERERLIELIKKIVGS